MNAILAPLILLLTVVLSVSLGILAAYWTLETLLMLLGQQQREPAPLLVEHHASGD